MERVKFRSQDTKQQAFAKAVRERVRLYFIDNSISKKGNLTLYIKTILMLGAYIIPFILILTASIPPIVALGLVLIMGIGEAGIGMSVMHDGAHGAYSSKKWANDLAASTMFLLGSNTVNWKIQHNIKHHTFSNVFEHDDDISTKAIIRLCEHAPIKKYHKYQHLYAFPLYGFMTFIRLFGEVFMLIKFNKSGIIKEHNYNPNKELVKLAITKITYLLVILGLPILLTDFSIWQILIGFAAMHVVAGMIMGTVFQMAHVVEGTQQPLPDNNEIIETEWMVHQLNTTSDFGRKKSLLSWYIGGLDFQIEHHLFQNISHVHYPAISKIVESTAKEYGINYNLKGNFSDALVSHYRRLKELGNTAPIKTMVN